MSDFFGNIALRSLPSSPGLTSGLLQPRLPALFEAPGGVDAVSAPPADGQARVELSGAVSTPQWESTPPVARREPARPLVEPQRTIIERVERDVVIKAPLSGKPSEPSERAADAQVTTAAGHPEQTIQPALRTLPAVSNPDTRTESRVLPGQPQLSITSERIPAKTDSRSGQLPPLSATAQIRDLPIVTDQPHQPVVQIHIGRIDVRAVTAQPAPAPRTAVSKSPRLTLDEYLRRRDEGKR